LAACDYRDAAVDGAEEDYSEGLYSFVRRVRESCKCRLRQTEPLTCGNVHIENRLVAAATFEKSYV